MMSPIIAKDPGLWSSLAFPILQALWTLLCLLAEIDVDIYDKEEARYDSCHKLQKVASIVAHPSESKVRQKALLVGISYAMSVPHMDFVQLDGPHEDIEQMRTFLKGKFRTVTESFCLQAHFNILQKAVSAILTSSS